MGKLFAGIAGISVLCAGSPAWGARQSIMTHMEVLDQSRRDPTLAELPSIRIETILASVPLNDRFDADLTFDRPYAEALVQGMSWYLSQRGVLVVERGERLRITGIVDDFEGDKGWGDWGARLEMQLKIDRQDGNTFTRRISSYLKYTDDEDVEDKERLKYKAKGLRGTLQEILFTRVGMDLGEKLILLLKENVRELTDGESPSAGPTESSRQGGSISIDASVPHAEILIDGNLIGTTPFKELPLPIGRHTLEVRKPGFLPWVREFHVLEGVHSRFFAELPPDN